ncbi:putative quinol monooxygenase [Pseudomonas sp. NPDC088368]|uniref:putative quinol monooxygenase n=1 Tax=Pseudomonas sp. NPDC088368 TaxID=3364453 RepID=UPI0038032705
MTLETCNTVRIHAAHGRSQELGEYLAGVVKNLPSVSGCLSSTLNRDEADQDLWIIDVRWPSCEVMAAHFAKPSNEGLNGLLSNCFVRQVAFESDAEHCNFPTSR